MGKPGVQRYDFRFPWGGVSRLRGKDHKRRKKFMVLIDKMREKVEGGKAVLRLFERGVLIFPVGVTMLVGVALLGGGYIGVAMVATGLRGSAPYFINA